MQETRNTEYGSDPDEKIGTVAGAVLTTRRKLPPQVKRDLAKAKPSLAGWTAKVTDRVLAVA